MYHPYWDVQCTAGFMWGGFGVTGFVTAGHCRDAISTSPISLLSPWDSYQTVSETCPSGGGDYQSHPFINVIDPSEHFEDKSGFGPVMIEAVAGGYTVGQLLVKIGRWANSTSTSWGHVSSFGTISINAGGDCGAGSFTGLRTTALTNAGDSGGPIMLVWNNKYYAASITASRSSSGYANGTWIPWIDPAAHGWGPSAHWCTRQVPCGAID